MKKGSPYFDHGFEFREFLKTHGFKNVFGKTSWVPFYRECLASMDEDCPSESSFKMAFNGQRHLPGNVILFVMERYKYMFDWRNLPLAQNRRGEKAKDNQLYFQGIREMNQIAQRRRLV